MSNPRLHLRSRSFTGRRKDGMLVGVFYQDRLQDARFRSFVLGTDVVQVQIGIQHQNLQYNLFVSRGNESVEFDVYRSCSGEASVDEPIFVQLVQFLKILERHTTLLRAGTFHHPFVHHFRARSQVNCGYSSTLLIKKYAAIVCYLPIKSAWI